ncbi:zinc transporter 1 [Trichuris trichiura]|uniref:Zinc transporter 1 n=1 Tax=Trichuris trichiura TaxID=36087 RepID=A0A077YVX4_TRITR|nr:zinc transporter 1 [Trichuris trichiura]
MGTFSGKSCRLLVMLVLTFSFFLVEIIFGYVTNSTALVADSFHMLSDVLALFIAFVCMKFSRRSPSSKNTFGWIRAEVLGALVNAVFLLALCFSIFIEGLKRLVEPEEIEHPLQILIVGVIGLIVNVIGIFMFHGHASLSGHGHSHGKRLVSSVSEQDEFEGSIEQLNSLSGAHNISVLADSVKSDVFNNVTNESARRKRDYKDPKLIPDITSTQMNMHGVFLHVLGDAFGSVIVIVNAIICWQVDSITLRRYLDPSLSLCLALIITCTTVPLRMHCASFELIVRKCFCISVKESALILLQTVPTHINVDQIQLKLLHSIDGVLAVHELHIWRLAGNKIIATAHIHCRNLEDYMKIAEKVKEFFHREGIHSTTIQPEFVELADVKASQEKVSCALECPGTKKECAPSTCCGPKTNSAGGSPSPGVSPLNVST